MKELWLVIPAYPRYAVSTLGRIQNRGTKRMLKAGTLKTGYLVVSLCGNGKPRTMRVSRLVAQAFIPNPSHLPEVNHIDTNKRNNTIFNLEWRSKLGNMQHATQHELQGDGVYYAKDRHKWVAAYAPAPQVWKYIGIYATYKQAKVARDAVIQSQQERT